jgi:hypothetical protein
MGIHGEPGREQQQLPEVNAADHVADIMLSTIIGISLSLSLSLIIHKHYLHHHYYYHLLIHCIQRGLGEWCPGSIGRPRRG